MAHKPKERHSLNPKSNILCSRLSVRTQVIPEYKLTAVSIEAYGPIWRKWAVPLNNLEALML